MIRKAANKEEVLKSFEIENVSYPPDVAASLPAFLERLRLFGAYFFVAVKENQIIGVANGVRLDHDDLSDEGMKQLSGYTVNGRYFCLLTVAVDPRFRRKGYATQLLQAIVRQAETDRLESVLLMCEEHLVPLYEQAGFSYVRPSVSLHGGIEWHEMRLKING
jgi:GNAT superfamily N-acetyltransferase